MQLPTLKTDRAPNAHNVYTKTLRTGPRHATLHIILHAIVSIKCAHDLKFDEIVMRNIKQVQSDSTYAVLRAMLYRMVSP